MNKLVCIVGMAGSGKSVVSDELVRRGYGFLRFGQLTLDIIQQRGLAVSEGNERAVREDLRKKNGMGAYALLNIPKFDELLKKGNVVGDGMYSWSEYKVLKERYGSNFFVVSVYSPPPLRYSRLSNRVLSASDSKARFRPMTPEQAKLRDYAEIENIEKGGPIAMADFTLLNTSSIEDLLKKLSIVVKEIEKD